MNRSPSLRPLFLFFGLLLSIALWGCTPSPVCGVSEYLVTKAADTNDGVCDASDCSLREAIINANACPGHQTIRIPPDGYTLTITGMGEDAAATGDLDITDDVTLVGMEVPSIEADGIDRVFEVFSPAVVEMELMVVAEGREQLGAGIRNHSDLTLRALSIQRNEAVVPSGGSGLSSGGGIFNESGTLTLINTQIFENTADHGAGIHNFATGTLNATNLLLGVNEAAQDGGGLWNNTAATAELEDVEFYMNSAAGDGAGLYNAGDVEIHLGEFNANSDAARGGGLFNDSGASAILYEAWFTNNSADLGGGLYNLGLVHLYESSITINTAFGGYGGGAYNDGAVPGLLLRNTTVSGNMVVPPSTPGGAGVYNTGGDLLFEFTTFAYNSPDGILNSGGTLNIRSSALAYHASANCSGVGTPSNGWNLEDADTCGLIESSDQINTDPLLAPLAINGGTNLSHALNPGSPAIDNGDKDKCIAYDQRGVSRPQGAWCDVGAYEVEAPLPPSPTPTPTPTPTPAPLGTVTGLICYPSEFIPPMTLYFKDVGTSQVLDFAHNDGSMNYSVQLPPSTYVAYAYRTGTNIAGSYSQAVLCGLTVNCTDHSLIPFQVTGGQTTADIDICDYYGQPGDIPAPPGGAPTEEAQSNVVAGTYIKNGFCREGPDSRYADVTALVEGTQVMVEGRSPDDFSTWWWVKLPGSEAHCWSSDSVLELVGPKWELPVITPPPLPEPISPPEPPGQLDIGGRVCNEKQYEVTLTWVDQASSEQGYRVYRDGALIATLPANATSYTDAPGHGGPYLYEVEAFNDGGASARAKLKEKGC